MPLCAMVPEFRFQPGIDQFAYALIFTSTLAAKTMPVAIAEFVARYNVTFTGMIAGSIIAVLSPCSWISFSSVILSAA
jgi:multiple sugar transport system permease protein